MLADIDVGTGRRCIPIRRTLADGGIVARDLGICVWSGGGKHIRWDDALDDSPLVSVLAESARPDKARLIATAVERPTMAGVILVRAEVP